MALRFILICSAVLFITWHLDQAYGASNATDRNRQRKALRTGLKAIAVDLVAWNRIAKNSFGLNTRAGQLNIIIRDVTPVANIKAADFRSNKKSTSDATIAEQAMVKALVAHATKILGGLTTMKIDVNGNPANDSKAKTAIAAFETTYIANINSVKTEYEKAGVQQLLALQD